MSARGPYSLSVPSKKGEVLVVGEDGRVFYDFPVKGMDNTWSLEPVTGKKDGFYLVSRVYRLAIDYDPSRGEEVRATPFDGVSSHTVWYTTKDSEIYTIDSDGEKRYLWNILDSVYVTPDEHLAEKWTAVSMEGFDIGLSASPAKNSTISAVLIIGSILLVLIILFVIFGV